MDSREELNEALERTVHARNAWFEISLEITPRARTEAEFPTLFRSFRDDGVLPTAMLVLFNVLGAIMRFSKKGRRTRTQEREWWPEAAQGVIDFVEWRAATDFGYRASIEAGGEEWAGFHDQKLDTIEPRAPLATGPLWLLGLLRGATEVAFERDEIVEGIRCRRFAIRADLGVAAAVSKFDLAVPPVKGFRALSQLSASASIDPDGRLRRLRFHYDDRATQAITLLDFDAADSPDWSRLPRFRSRTRRPSFVLADPKSPR